MGHQAALGWAQIASLVTHTTKATNQDLGEAILGIDVAGSPAHQETYGGRAMHRHGSSGVEHRALNILVSAACVTNEPCVCNPTRPGIP